MQAVPKEQCISETGEGPEQCPEVCQFDRYLGEYTSVALVSQRGLPVLERGPDSVLEYTLFVFECIDFVFQSVFFQAISSNLIISE